MVSIVVGAGIIKIYKWWKVREEKRLSNNKCIENKTTKDVEEDIQNAPPNTQTSQPKLLTPEMVEAEVEISMKK